MAATLFFSFVMSAVGMAYIVYGRRQQKFAPLIAGIALCLYTYFVDGWMWLGGIGIVLAVAPFFLDF
jgi:hypothetical protein